MSSRNRWINRLAKRSAVIAAAASACAGLTNQVLGSSGTWGNTAGGGNWNVNANWTGGVIPGINNFGVNDTAFMNAVNITGNFGVTLDVSVTLGQINFSDLNAATNSTGNWTVSTASNRTISLNSGTATPTISVTGLANTLNYANITTVVSSTAGLTKTGNARLILGNVNNSANIVGTVNIQGGTLQVNSINNLSSDATINFQTTANGVLAVHSDTAQNFTSKSLFFIVNGGIDVNEDSLSGGLVSGLTHTFSTLTLLGGGSRTVAITGSNNYGVNVGTVILALGNNGAVINNLNPGALTIGTFLSQASATSTLTISGTGTTNIGPVQINQVNQGSSTLNVVYSDTKEMNIGSFNGLTGALIMTGGNTTNSTSLSAGGGTLTINQGVLPTGNLTVNHGTLILNTPATHSVGSLTMGGGTLGTGNITAAVIRSTINLNGGTLVPSGNITVNTGTFNGGNQAGPNGATTATQTIATLNGNLELGSTDRTITVNRALLQSGTATTELIVNGVTNGSGVITKLGQGELRLNGANTLTGAFNMAGGTLSAVARTSGNAFPTGVTTLTSGTLRVVNDTAIDGSASLSTVSFIGETLDPTKLVVDARAGGSVTMNINTFNGRDPGTNGILTIIPSAGSLGTNERILITTAHSSLSPVNGMWPAYVAAQVSEANQSLDFVTRTGTSVVRAAYTTGGNINTSTNATVFQADGTSNNVVGAATHALAYAVKVEGVAGQISGTGSMTIGNGVAGQIGGLILNDGQVSVSTLSFNSTEAVIWAGGLTGGTISSNVSLNGNITTGGPRNLVFTGAGSMNLGGAGLTRIFTVGSGTTILQIPLANGNLFKSGPGVLQLESTSTGYNGHMVVNAGTMQLGNGVTAGAGGAVLGNTASVTVNSNGSLVFNQTGSYDIGNQLHGPGSVVQNNASSTLRLTSASSTYQQLWINSGSVQLSANNRIPTTATVNIVGGATNGTLDLAGFNQTIGNLNGAGRVWNSVTGTQSTLTFKEGNGTFTGVLGNNGSANIQVVKNGPGTQVLSAANPVWLGGMVVNEGTMVSANNDFDARAFGGQTTQITLNGGTIEIRAGAPGSGAFHSLANPVHIPAGATAAIASNGSGSGGTMENRGAWTGGGTVILYKQNNVFYRMGNNFSAFTGTIDFVSNAQNGNREFSLATDNNPGVFGSPTTFFKLNDAQIHQSNANFTVGDYPMGGISGGPLSELGHSGGNLITYTIGFLSQDNTFQGTVLADTAALATGIKKVGFGDLVMTGTMANSFGATTVNGGKLILAGSAAHTGTSTIIINSGGELGMIGNATISGSKSVHPSGGVFNVSGTNAIFSTPSGITIAGGPNTSGTVAGNYLHNAGVISPGGIFGAATTSFNTVANWANLTLGGGAVLLDIETAGVSGTGVNDLIFSYGVTEFTTSNSILVNKLGANFGTADIGNQYPIMRTIGTRVGALPTPANIASLAQGATFSLIETAAGSGTLAGTLISLVLTGFDPNAVANSITWTGSVDSNWEVAGTPNFSTGGSPTAFIPGDSLVFNDTGDNRSINLQAVPMSFGTLTVNNSLVDYTFSGLGTLAGGGRLVKTGTQTLIINNINSYTGGTSISGGGAINISSTGVGTNSALGSGSVTLNGGSLIVSSGTARASNNIAVPAGAVGTIIYSASGGTLAGNLIVPSNSTLSIRSNDNNGRNVALLSTDQSQAVGTVALGLAATGNITVQAGSPLPFNQKGAQAAFGNQTIWHFLNNSALQTRAGDYLRDTNINFGALITTDTTLRPVVTPQFNSGQPPSGSGYPARHYAVVGAANVPNSSYSGTINQVTIGSLPGYSGGTNDFSPFGFVKVGTGTMTLTGGIANATSNYSGETFVNGGTLILGPFYTLSNSKAVYANGGTFSFANATGTITNMTRAMLFSANNGGVIDFRNLYSEDNDDSISDPPNIGYGQGPDGVLDTYVVPQGVTVTGRGGTILAAHVKLGVSDTVGGTLSAGTLGIGHVGTLTFSGALDLNGGKAIFDVNRTNSTNDRIIAAHLMINSIPAIDMSYSGNPGAVGTNVTILQFTDGDASQISLPTLRTNARGVNASLSTVGNEVRVTVTQQQTSMESLVWLGNNASGVGGTPSRSWNVNTTNNWRNNQGTADFFYPTDAVSFTSEGGLGTVILTQAVFPRSVNVNINSGSYIFAADVSYWAGANADNDFGGNLGDGNNVQTYSMSNADGPLRDYGRISGTAGLLKQGDGLLRVMTNNDYTGGTSIQGGRIELGQIDFGTNTILHSAREFEANFRNGSLGSGPINISAGAQLSYVRNDGAVIANNISGAGAFIVDQVGLVQLEGNNTYTGGTTIGHGTLRLGVNNAIPGGTDVAILSLLSRGNAAVKIPAYLDLNGFNQSIGHLKDNGVSPYGTNGFGDLAVITNTNATSGTSVLTINTATYSGAINGNVSLVKVGSGTASMFYTNFDPDPLRNTTYSGQTLVNQGTLVIGTIPGAGRVRGSHLPSDPSTATYSIASGAALMSNGTIDTTVRVLAGGRLVPGLSVGTMTTRGLELNNTSILDFEVGLGQADAINVTGLGGLTLTGGTVTLNVNSLFASGNSGTYTLIDYLANVPLTPGQFAGLSLNATGFDAGYSVSLVNNQANSSIDLLVVNPTPANSSWNVNASGTWVNESNWTALAVPNAKDSIATFGSAISAARTVVIESGKSVATINFNNAAASYSLVGTSGSTVTFNATSGAVGINVLNGTHSMSAPLRFLANGTVNVAAGAQLSVGSITAVGDAEAFNVNKIGDGTLVADSIKNTFGANTTGGALNVLDGTLRISEKATANQQNGTSKIKSLSISAGAVLDLTNNSMIIDYNGSVGSILSDVRGMLADGRLTTSSAESTPLDVRLGYRDNDDTSGRGMASANAIGGVGTDDTSVLIKFTFGGDINLDGKVDIIDLFNFNDGYRALKQNGGLAGTQFWNDGDFNYDGSVTEADLQLLVRDWQAGVGAPLGGDLSAALAALGLPNVAVPEPATAGLAGLAVTGLLARRRRRS